MIELQSLDAVHGGDPERRGVVTVGGVRSDFVNLTTCLSKRFGQLLTFVIGTDGHA